MLLTARSGGAILGHAVSTGPDLSGSGGRLRGNPATLGAGDPSPPALALQDLRPGDALQIRLVDGTVLQRSFLRMAGDSLIVAEAPRTGRRAEPAGESLAMAEVAELVRREGQFASIGLFLGFLGVLFLVYFVSTFPST